MAQRLGVAEADAAGARAATADMRAMLEEAKTDRDAWRLQAEVVQEQVHEALRQLAEARRELTERLTERRPGLLARLWRWAG